MEKIVEFNPGYDKRNPIPSKNYGIHCVTLRMILKGELGAVHFVLYTGWYPKNVRDEGVDCSPMGVDVGYHSKIPCYEGQQKTENCPYIGCDCYSDGSGIYADEMFNIMTDKGDKGVWEELEVYYTKTFGELK